ncbi:MAG: GGDEF domain-containing protein [Congregibacter sp.]|nr:GGDEF domain-containing protein [Congregibacter sp.]MDP5069622.1 GGDEF domain-containing protein [Congregibacter sp.]
MNEENGADSEITNIEMTVLPVENDAEQAGQEVVSLHLHVLRQLRKAQRTLLGVKSLSSLVKYLLEDLPQGFGPVQAELRLHDPEDQIARLLPIRELFGNALSLKADNYALYQLYPDVPEVAFMDLDDRRMFTILAGATSAAGAAMMPLFDGNRLIGSYHIGFTDEMTSYAEPERELFAMLGQLIAAALLRVVEYQRVDQLTLLDPVTEVGNLRAFRRDMLREIYWARRVNHPMTLLYISLDELSDICKNYGEVACRFVQRRVSQRLCSELRATDYIAHVSATHFAVLLPACNEPHAHDIGERMRQDIDDFAIDDGRGAVLHVSLSVGLVCWEPSRHPVESSERLATQMESEAESAMQKAARDGGNRISVARLGLLML